MLVAYNWHFEVLVPYWPVFVNGAIVTMELTFVSAALGTVIGLPAAIGREVATYPEFGGSARATSNSFVEPRR